MSPDTIKDNIAKIMQEIPEGVTLVAAAKARTPEEVSEAVSSGVTIIGENYLQEAVEAFGKIGNAAKWHFIGHLQKNKVKKAVKLFDMIETVDSLELAEEIDKRCGDIGRVMPVLIEVNSGGEIQKFGVLPQDVPRLAKGIARLENIKLVGLMTMGPFSEDAEEARPYFVKTREVFNELKETGIENVEMKYLSMGMTSSYSVAIEEGANIIRIGTKIFGIRE